VSRAPPESAAPDRPARHGAGRRVRRVSRPQPEGPPRSDPGRHRVRAGPPVSARRRLPGVTTERRVPHSAGVRGCGKTVCHSERSEESRCGTSPFA